jgi:virulence-associated protein VagC
LNRAILEELRALGVEVMPHGDNLVIRPASKVPPDLKARLRAAKTEVLAALAQAIPEAPANAHPHAEHQDALPANIELPLRRCPACNSWLFWVSMYGVVVCSNCHPPASQSVVKQWYWLPEGERKTLQ